MKITELDKQKHLMQTKINKALQKQYDPKANEIVSGLRKDSRQANNILGKKQQLDLSYGLPYDEENRRTQGAEKVYQNN